MALTTHHFKSHGHTDEKHDVYIYICDGDLRYAHITKTTTNKTLTLTDYWVSIRVHKSIGSCQLGSSLQSSFPSYFHTFTSYDNHLLNIYFLIEWISEYIRVSLKPSNEYLNIFGMLLESEYFRIWIYSLRIIQIYSNIR